MRTQAFIRRSQRTSPSALAAVELLVSVQTELLDSCPAFRFKVTSRPDRCDWMTPSGAASSRSDQRLILLGQSRERGAATTTPDCFLFRLASTDFSYVEIVHPADAGESICQRRQSAAAIFSFAMCSSAAGWKKGSSFVLACWDCSSIALVTRRWRPNNMRHFSPRRCR